MRTRVSPTLVGLFVLGAILIAIVGIVSFGGINFFSSPKRFIVYFDESTHGLDLGSPVKLRGVRVGRVVDMNVVYNGATNASVVAVVCEFSRNIIVDSKGSLIDVNDRKSLQQMIKHGLRAELGIQGLATGLLFVELDFRNPSEFANQPPPAVTMLDDKGYVVIPATTSAIAALQANITDLLADVKRMNLPEFTHELRGLIKDLRGQVNSLDLASLNTELTRAGKSVASLAESAEVRRMFIDMSSAIAEFRRTLSRFDRAVGPVGERLDTVLVDAQTAINKVGEAADAAKQLVEAQGGLGEDATRALRQFSETAETLQQLLDYLERNPSAIISGKKQP
ncbi:paraquat-inducible protein B [Ereboglobus sp. PH5-5]|uniref:MlaD family protein n=1 Tax=Ereboglobus sp. PH5-5 TaxID=2940529 RepID=UPI002405EE60|nr:MlaD family protein [Ereboglobus sp. PH5-5]MDF9831842.1 paraquat-inducible protein B [Ereboglobus sp. PH5-5]